MHKSHLHGVLAAFTLFALPAGAQTESRYLDCYSEITAATLAIKAFRDGGAEISYSYQEALNALFNKFTVVILKSGISPEKITDTIANGNLEQKMKSIVAIGQAGGVPAALSLIENRVEECLDDFEVQLSQ